MHIVMSSDKLALRYDLLISTQAKEIRTAVVDSTSDLRLSSD